MKWQEKFQLSQTTHQECHLRSKDDLVSLKQASCCVCEHREGDAVNQVQHSLFNFLSCLSAINGFLKDNTECLKNNNNGPIKK